jgi:prepilin-type N-terminal cleavage/methylation domain-containing protein
MMITAHVASRPSTGARGFSLIELLLAIFILGVGIISVAAVFPAGIIQQRRTQDDVLGPVIAEAAMATIRSKVTQSDFGTFEEFGIFGPGSFSFLDQPFPNSWLDPGDAYTQPGDWPWIRPSMAAVPVSASPGDRSYAGDVDLFSARVARGSSLVNQDYPASMQWDAAWRTTEFSLFGGAFPVFGDSHPQAGGGGNDAGAFLFGVPFSRAKFDFFGNGEDPLVTIKQGERFWPAGTGFGPGLERPQYAWDCMFRRFQGRVQVAIFVYRVNAANTPGGYAVCQDGGSTILNRQATRPPMPARIDFPATVGSQNFEVLTPLGDDNTANGTDYARQNIVPNTQPDFGSPGNLISLDPYFEGWQSPGQWMLDPYGRIHRVVQGRRNKRQGPVRLARPSPTQNPSTALYNPAAQAGSAAGNFARWQTRVNEVRSLWFIPTADRRGVGLEPVYVSVRDL